MSEVLVRLAMFVDEDQVMDVGLVPSTFLAELEDRGLKFKLLAGKYTLEPSQKDKMKLEVLEDHRRFLEDAKIPRFGSVTRRSSYSTIIMDHTPKILADEQKFLEELNEIGDPELSEWVDGIPQLLDYKELEEVSHSLPKENF